MDDDQVAVELADRGRRFILDRLGILPVEVGTNKEAGVALLTLGRKVGAFYIDRAEPSLTVLVNTSRGPVLVAGIRSANQLAGSLALDPRLTDEEVGEALADLRHSRIAG